MVASSHQRFARAILLGVGICRMSETESYAVKAFISLTTCFLLQQQSPVVINENNTASDKIGL